MLHPEFEQKDVGGGDDDENVRWDYDMFMHKYHCYFAESMDMKVPPSFLVSREQGFRFYKVAKTKVAGIIADLDHIEEHIYINEVKRIMRALDKLCSLQLVYPELRYATQ
jgi:hypothetical protein